MTNALHNTTSTCHFTVQESLPDVLEFNSNEHFFYIVCDDDYFL